MGFDGWSDGWRTVEPYVKGEVQEWPAARRARYRASRERQMFVPGPWITEGACRGSDPEVFFPERGESTADAKAVCARCTVRVECLEFALDTRQMEGVWGGCSARERKQLLRRRMVEGKA